MTNVSDTNYSRIIRIVSDLNLEIVYTQGRGADFLTHGF